MLLTDLATITDRERFRERVERWQAEDAKAVGCCYVGDLTPGQSFRFRPGGTTHTVLLCFPWDEDEDGVWIHCVNVGERRFWLRADACVQLVEPQP